MSEGMTIRNAVEADLPRIVDIYNSTVASRMVTPDLEPVSVASRLEWFAAHTADRWPLWMAVCADETLGWLSFSKFHPRAAYDVTSELSIYIAANHRGRGVGAALLRRAIGHAPQIGIANLIGLIFAHNHPSIRLFEKFRFMHWGNLPRVCVLDGVERDVAILGLRLAA